MNGWPYSMVVVMKLLRFKRRGKMVSVMREAGRYVAMDEKKRFMSKTQRRGGCWIWTDAPDKDGYGKFQLASGPTERAHRTAWRLFHGEIPPKMHCLHTCDTPACVNPKHLWLGTQADNIADMIAKGRRARPNSAINEATASKIKARLRAGERPTQIARAMRLTRTIVFSIKYGKTWRDVPCSTLL